MQTNFLADTRIWELYASYTAVYLTTTVFLSIDIPDSLYIVPRQSVSISPDESPLNHTRYIFQLINPTPSLNSFCTSVYAAKLSANCPLSLPVGSLIRGLEL